MAPASRGSSPGPEGGLAGAATWSGPPEYHGLEVLSPMVRASSLPLRLCCLRYGAGLVYSGVEIDRKVLESVRVENADFGCIDYVSRREKRAIWSTCEEERGRVIFQVGTADPVLAARAALHVCRDVRGIDVNMGCTAPFSETGGMGAALLEKPALAADILRTLRRELPSECAVSCKIRLLPTIARTRDFMQLCERSGADAVAVHLRTQEEDRNQGHPARWDEIAAVCDAVRIPVIANGDFLSRGRIAEFWRRCREGSGTTGESGPNGDQAAAGGAGAVETGAAARGPAAVMIARGALWNPSIFRRGAAEGEAADEPPPEYGDVLRTYVRTAARVNNAVNNTKWVLREMLNRTHCSAEPVPTDLFGGTKALRRFKQQLDFAGDMAQVCKLFGETHDASIYPPGAHTLNYGLGLLPPLDPDPSGGTDAGAGAGEAWAGSGPPCEGCHSEGTSMGGSGGGEGADALGGWRW